MRIGSTRTFRALGLVCVLILACVGTTGGNNPDTEEDGSGGDDSAAGDPGSAGQAGAAETMSGGGQAAGGVAAIGGAATAGTGGGGIGAGAGRGGAGGTGGTNASNPDAGTNAPDGGDGLGAAYPNADNVGVPKGLALTTSKSITVTQNGRVIDAMDVTGCITVRANEVRITRTRIHAACWEAIHMDEGFKGLAIEDVDIDGQGVPGAIVVFGDYQMRRAHIYNFTDGPRSAGNILIEDSYIHSLTGIKNGFMVSSGDHTVLRHNTIEFKGGGGSSAILIQAAHGSVDDVVIEDNLLAGGDQVTLWVASGGGGYPSNVKILNNKFSNRIYPRGGRNGPLSVENSVTVSGNVWLETGLPVR